MSGRRSWWEIPPERSASRTRSTGTRFHLETASLVIPQGTAIRRQRPR